MRREELVKHLGEDSPTVIAFDVERCYRRAFQNGLGLEWFEEFLAEIAAGRSPQEAAWNSCYEWDC